MDHRVDAMIYSMAALAPPRADAAGVLLRDGHGRILLVKSPYKAYWDLPGGMVEPGEAPPAAAEREVLEELGLQLRAGPLLAADYLRPTPTRREGMRWVFDGGMVGRGLPLQLQPEEISEVRWCDRHEVARLTGHHAPMLERRIQAAVNAVFTERIAMLIDGWPRVHTLQGFPAMLWITTS